MTQGHLPGLLEPPAFSTQAALGVPLWPLGGGAGLQLPASRSAFLLPPVLSFSGLSGLSRACSPAGHNLFSFSSVAVSEIAARLTHQGGGAVVASRPRRRSAAGGAAPGGRCTWAGAARAGQHRPGLLNQGGSARGPGAREGRLATPPGPRLLGPRTTGLSRAPFSAPSILVTVM